GGEGIERYLDAWGESAAEELTTRADDIEVRGGTEIHHYGGSTVESEGGERVHDAVRADLLRIVDDELDSGTHDRLDAEARHRRVVPIQHGAQGSQRLRHC